MASRGLAVSKKQCCDILGWTSSQFDKAVREGMPVSEHPSGRGTDYVVFMGDVIRWIVKQELLAAGHEPNEAAPLDLNAERARLAREQADKTAMENALARGELVRASEVARAEEILFTALRDRIMAVQSEAPLLREAAVKDGTAAVREHLRKVSTDALEDIGSETIASLQAGRTAA